jgi:hypothetical protein
MFYTILHNSNPFDLPRRGGTMSEAITRNDASPFAASPGRRDLRASIGWICHGLRIAAVVWVGSLLAVALLNWTDKAAVLQAYGQFMSLDLSDVSNTRYAAAFTLVLGSCATGVAVAVCIWGLAGTYLAGRVFTVDAAVWLRRIGIAGIVAVVVNVLARYVVLGILTGQLVPVPRYGLFILPQDLLHLIFAVFVLGLARIFKAAAEMADDHAQIV